MGTHTDLPFSHVCFLRGGRKHVSHCGSGAGRGPRPEATSEADEISEWPGRAQALGPNYRSRTGGVGADGVGGGSRA